MITAHGKNVVANHYRDLVDNVVLNEEEAVINDFTIKEVSQDLFTLEFDVPSIFTSLTRVRLRDQNNSVLSDSKLYIPISADTRYKHTTRIQGG